jgi:hypothetical protein
VVMWVVRIPLDVLEKSRVSVKKPGVTSLSWRPVAELIDSLKKVQDSSELGKEIKRWLGGAGKLIQTPDNSIITKAPRVWLENQLDMQSVLLLISMHEIMQEVGYAMMYAFRSEEAQIIWAGLGRYDRSIRPAMRGRSWVTRLALTCKWKAVSNNVLHK